MKSSQVVAFVAISTVLAFSPTASKSAEDNSKDKALILAAITKMDIAYAAKDADGYVAYTDPDFVNVSSSGEETTHGKEERRQKVMTTFAKLTNIAAKITSHSTAQSIVFSEEGATVVEDSFVTYSGHLNSQARIIKDHNISRDFWVRSSAGWLEKRSRTLSSKITLNGKVIP